MEKILFGVRCHRHESCLSGSVALSKFFILNNLPVSSFVKWGIMGYTSLLQRWNGIAWKYLACSSYLISVTFLDWLILFIPHLWNYLAMKEVPTEVKARRRECANNSGCCCGGAFTLGLDRAKREHMWLPYGKAKVSWRWISIEKK